jgi:hypothetical protein
MGVQYTTTLTKRVEGSTVSQLTDMRDLFEAAHIF